jgi:hypothetical protein
LFATLVIEVIVTEVKRFNTGTQRLLKVIQPRLLDLLALIFILLLRLVVVNEGLCLLSSLLLGALFSKQFLLGLLILLFLSINLLLSVKSHLLLLLGGLLHRDEHALDEQL